MKLTEFVRASFQASFNRRNVEEVKRLNYITKDLQIPSKSKKNIANLINVKF